MFSVMDELFGAVGEPDWLKIHALLQVLSAPELTITQILRLQWLYYNDPDEFDDLLVYYVEIADGN